MSTKPEALLHEVESIVEPSPRSDRRDAEPKRPLRRLLELVLRFTHAVRFAERWASVPDGRWHRLGYRMRRRMLALNCAKDPHGLVVHGRIRLHRARGATLKIGDRVELRDGVLLYLHDADSVIEIGDGVFLNFDTRLVAVGRIAIGAGTAIAWNVSIMDSDAHSIDGKPVSADTILGERVWVGSGSIITKGVTVGDGAVIAAGSVVVKDVPAGALVAGVPARVLRDNVTWADTPALAPEDSEPGDANARAATDPARGD